MEFSHKEEGYPAICKDMDGLWAHYAKWGKSEKDKYYILSLNAEPKKTKQDSKIVVTSGRGVGGKRVLNKPQLSNHSVMNIDNNITL